MTGTVLPDSQWSTWSRSFRRWPCYARSPGVAVPSSLAFPVVRSGPALWAAARTIAHEVLGVGLDVNDPWLVTDFGAAAWPMGVA